MLLPPIEQAFSLGLKSLCKVGVREVLQSTLTTLPKHNLAMNLAITRLYTHKLWILAMLRRIQHQR